MRLAVFEPVFRGELGDGLVGVVGDLGQHVLEVVEGIDAPVAAGLDDGEEDGATLAAIGVADWQVGAGGFPRGSRRSGHWTSRPRPGRAYPTQRVLNQDCSRRCRIHHAHRL